VELGLATSHLQKVVAKQNHVFPQNVHADCNIIGKDLQTGKLSNGSNFHKWVFAHTIDTERLDAFDLGQTQIQIFSFVPVMKLWCQIQL
tara:strand:- start:394 stop:660 length:267 start_codon:yes stop_codon:yes gene_type:complete